MLYIATELEWDTYYWDLSSPDRSPIGLINATQAAKEDPEMLKWHVPARKDSLFNDDCWEVWQTLQDGDVVILREGRFRVKETAIDPTKSSMSLDQISPDPGYSYRHFGEGIVFDSLNPITDWTTGV